MNHILAHLTMIASVICVSPAADLNQSLHAESALDRNAAAQDAVRQSIEIKNAAVAILRDTAASEEGYVDGTDPVALALAILREFRTDDVGDLLVKHVRTFVTGIDSGRKAERILISNGESSIPAVLNGIRLATEVELPVLCHALAAISKSTERAEGLLRQHAAASKDRSVTKKFEQVAAKLPQYIETDRQANELKPIQVPANAWDEKPK